MANQNDELILAGCGNMGRAMLQGWLANGILEQNNVHVVEPNDELRQLATDLGVHTYASADQVPEALTPSLIVLAVKPQVMFDVTPAYEKYIASGATFLSVAAGVRVDKFEEALGSATPIIRVMPNTPAAISKGMMVIYSNANVTDEQNSFVVKLMQSSGEVAMVDNEALMDAVTAVSGSGPAYIFHFIEALRDAGIAAGLPETTAKLLAEQTIYGAACYAHDSDIEPGILREQVTSPNGTTAAALDVLMNDGALKNLVTKAVEAAKKRSEEVAD
ncbi:MAG: pyrroline-5-carboxylate reductase [Pseudomonadota bacterium]